MLGQDAT